MWIDEHEKFAVFIGRMQPPTKAHLEIITKSLEKYGKILILVGSSNASLSPKNPLTFDYRYEFLHSYLSDIGYTEGIHYHVEPLPDFPYNNYRWSETVMDQIRACFIGKIRLENVHLVGFEKDESSEYLKFFPEINYEHVDGIHFSEGIMSATQLRESIFEGRPLSDEWFMDALHRELFDELLRDKIYAQKDYDDYNKKYQYDTRMVGVPYPSMFVCV